MSGRITAVDVIGTLYRHATDAQLPTLDDLVIATGFMRRCACTAMAPAHERCQVCGAAEQDEPDHADIATGRS
jgi:hypothetical protein